MKKMRGFSMVEILVIIALMASILLIAASLGKSPILKPQFSSLLNNFMADFNTAKTLACTENRGVAIVFDAGGRSYYLMRQEKVSDINVWKPVRKTEPLVDTNMTFFSLGDVTSFWVNSMGEVRSFPVVANQFPQQINLVFKIERSGFRTTATINVLPYGSLKIAKSTTRI